MLLESTATKEKQVISALRVYSMYIYMTLINDFNCVNTKSSTIVKLNCLLFFIALETNLASQKAAQSSRTMEVLFHLSILLAL